MDCISFFRDYVGNRTGWVSTPGLGAITAKINSTNSDANRPDVQIFHGSSNMARCSNYGICGEVRSLFATYSVLPAILNPPIYGNVTLNATNATGPSIIQYDPESMSKQMNTSLFAVDFVSKLINTASMKKHNLKFDTNSVQGCGIFNTTGYFECVIRKLSRPENHQCCTLQMAPPENDGVVDQCLRVYGVNNLRIVDASIMPILPSGNMQGPVMMIAEKAADIILTGL